MPPRTDFVLFLDLEATGSKDEDEIVEVGIVLLETQKWQEVASYTHVVEPTQAGYQRMMDSDKVRGMHEESGLLDDIIHYKMNLPGLATIGAIDTDVVEFLNKVIGKNTTHIPYGGSGVSWYDRKFIKRDMPKFDKRITHFALDVGPPKRMWKLAHVPWLVSEEADKTHRALEDARFHADEFRFVLRDLQEGWEAKRELAESRGVRSFRELCKYFTGHGQCLQPKDWDGHGERERGTLGGLHRFSIDPTTNPWAGELG